MRRMATISLFLVVALVVFTSNSEAIYQRRLPWASQLEARLLEDYPELAQEILDRYNSYLLQPEANKRALDLGFNRGFSGSKAAQHMMGIQAANFAGGPGRRRRSSEQA